MAAKMKDKTYSTTEAAALLNCTSRTVQRWCELGKAGKPDGTHRPTYLLTEADVEHLRSIMPRKGGRPAKHKETKTT